MFCEFEAMLYEFKPLFHEFASLLKNIASLFNKNEAMFHADKLMFYTNILILLSIFVEKESGDTEGMVHFLDAESHSKSSQFSIKERDARWFKICDSVNIYRASGSASVRWFEICD